MCYNVCCKIVKISIYTIYIVYNIYNGIKDILRTVLFYIYMFVGGIRYADMLHNDCSKLQNEICSHYNQAG